MASAVLQNLTWLDADADAGGSEYYGCAVDIDGDYAVVGCYNKFDGVIWPGIIHILYWDGSNWILQAKIEASDKAANDGFGFAAKICGTMVIVGAPYANGNAGKAYVYERTGAVWGTGGVVDVGVNETIIIASDAAANDYLGYDLDIDEGTRTAIIGAPGQDDFGAASGCIYPFVSPVAGTWNEQAKQYSSDIAAGHDFGKVVSMSGTSVAVTSPINGSTCGRVYVLTGAAAVWVEETPIIVIAGAGSYTGGFGDSLSLDANRLAIGSWGEDDGAGNTGAAYIYDRAVAVWSQTHRIACPAATAHLNAYFGWDVSTKGAYTAIVAKYQYIAPDVAAHGICYVYEPDASTTVPTVVINPQVDPLDGAISEITCCSLASGSSPVVVFGSESEDVDNGVAYLDTGTARFYLVATVLAIRTPVGGLYVDHLREEAASSEVMTINAIPEDLEDGVPYDELIRLQIVCTAAEALTLTRVWLTRSSDGIKVLAYDSGAGGFQAPYNGASSSVTVRSAAGSALNDEVVLVIDHTGDYTSLEYVTAEAYGATASFTGTDIYTFQIEDLTAPEPESILWLNPRRALLKFNEPMNISSEPGGSTFVELTKGNVDIVSTSQVQLVGVTPSTDWIGYWVGISGSFYPNNNLFRPITAVDTTTKRITLDTSVGYGGDLTIDDGIDTDDSGNIIQERIITAAVSSYRLNALLGSEGASDPPYTAERYQCAYEAFVIAAEIPNIADLPAGADIREYVYLDFNDDISYGRLYSIQVDMAEDLFENAASAATLNFTAPWFGYDTDRLGFWSPGIQSPPDREDDLDNTALLRDAAVVLQDLLQLIWHRADQLQYYHDPDRCPKGWIDHLLYNRGNPFTFPLDTESLSRRLGAALPGFYKKIGTVPGLTDLLYTLLGIEFVIEPFQSSDYWTIGSATLGKLGFTTTLGPGTAYRRNSYIVTSPVDLTTEERRIVTDVCTWGDPANKHLHRIIEPSSPDIEAQTIWIIGTSALGSGTVLGGS